MRGWATCPLLSDTHPLLEDWRVEGLCGSEAITAIHRLGAGGCCHQHVLAGFRDPVLSAPGRLWPPRPQPCQASDLSVPAICPPSTCRHTLPFTKDEGPGSLAIKGPHHLHSPTSSSVLPTTSHILPRSRCPVCDWLLRASHRKLTAWTDLL